MNIIKILSEELELKAENIQTAVTLMDEGNTIPFIARYRKEVTGYLTDNDLRKLEERLIYLRKLDERITTVLNSIEEQGKLTDELKFKIENVKTLSELEDIYRPYKPKKKTRASLAKEKGLEPLSKFIKENNEELVEEEAKKYINEEKGVKTLKDAIQGAMDIISEEISDNADYRIYIKNLINKNGLIVSKEIKKDEKDTFKQYSDYSELVSNIPPHRILAISRGEKEKCLRVSLDYDNELVLKYILKKEAKSFNKHIFETIIDDALKRLIAPSIENEIRNDLFSKAEDKSIIVFKKNLYQLLMYPPIKDKVILGFDPGFRTGCKYALVDKYGNPLKVGQVFITSNSEEQIKKGANEIKTLLNLTKIDYIALGNGTASRESETILRKVIDENKFDTKIFIVNESGASVYSASKLGEEEFPNLPVEKRSAISLARRLQDPLSELVKIDPKSIGVGQYQHDMDQNKLDLSLNGVVEDAVNSVGINLNTASISLLKYISGISKTLAKNIYEYRVKNGPFKNREELKNVKNMGPKAFEQCAGFLRIVDGNNILDNTSVHPESYVIATKLIKESNLDLLNDSIETKEFKLKHINKSKFISDTKVGEATLDDIINELIKPGRDIRDDVEIIELNNDVKDIKDLKIGMTLKGTVRNVMDFGIFVDINVHQDGLVHISELSKKFIKHPSDLYCVNDIVTVKVISLDIERRKIGLSIKQLNN